MLLFLVLLMICVISSKLLHISVSQCHKGSHIRRSEIYRWYCHLLFILCSSTRVFNVTLCQLMHIFSETNNPQLSEDAGCEYNERQLFSYCFLRVPAQIISYMKITSWSGTQGYMFPTGKYNLLIHLSAFLRHQQKRLNVMCMAKMRTVWSSFKPNAAI